MLTVIEEYTRECLAIEVARRLSSDDVLDVLARLMADRGSPDHLRSDQGPEFMANRVRAWLGDLGVRTAFIEKASPWENGCNESFNGKLRDELLNREIFYTMAEARILVERWRRHYNEVRPHSSLGYRPPAPAAIMLQPARPGSASEGLRLAGSRAEHNVRLT
jgi:putative transposase